MITNIVYILKKTTSFYFISYFFLIYSFSSFHAHLLALSPDTSHVCKLNKSLYILFTHFSPDRLSPPALFSYCATPDCPVAAGKQTFHTGIPAYANRNRILMRL